MHDRQLYARILGLASPWRVEDVRLDTEATSVEVVVAHDGSAALRCPECDEPCAGYDRRLRRWRHLDTCQYRTILACGVPRVECPEHGVLQVRIPWAEGGSRFTALFEALAIDWLREASFTAVGRVLGVSWEQLDVIQRRAVARGLQRRGQVPLCRIGVDETSFQKRHEYVTAVYDLAAEEARVLHVADHRGQEALDGFYRQYTREELAQLEAVSMDMWAPYVRSTEAHVPGASEKICFDPFHVAQHLSRAVDEVRRAEAKQLRSEQDDRLKRTRYLWLRAPERMEEQAWRDFAALRESTLKTARAWHLKEVARGLWGYVSRGWARRAWQQWMAWASRSKLAPVIRAARMIRRHLEGILNAIVKAASNARAESVNAKIQKLKNRACGFRNRERFKTAIYFHCGALDLYPRMD